MKMERHHLCRTSVLITLLTLVSLTCAAVPSPPTMVKQPPIHEQLYQVSETSDEQDKPFILECEAKGNPEPIYSWIKNGEEFDYVAYDRRISQQPRRGTLVFTKPDDVDEGLYQCFATNIHGTSMSNAVFLRKSELNSFPDEHPQEMHVMEGSPLTLDCNPPTGYPKPTIFWIIQSFSGSLRSINNSRITVDPEGDLHFSNVTRDDALDDAMYACSATSTVRNEYKLGNKVIVKVEPSGNSASGSHRPIKQYVSPPNIVALRDQALELSCIYGGTPLPDIEWKKKGGNLATDRFTFINYGKTLKIRKVDFEDEGTYECTASNGVGSQQTHAMAVVVQASPFWITSPTDTSAAEEESVRFECKASGVPEPKLQWFVNGVPIEDAKPNPRRKVEGEVMIIESLAKTDTAVYQCNASNVHGYAFADFYMNVLALPPTIIEAPEAESTAVVTSTITLNCRVFGAPQPEVTWMRDGQELTGGRYQVLENGGLKITEVLVTDKGEYTCYATNKFGDTSASGVLDVKGKTRITQPPENFEVAAGKSATFRCNAEADPSLELTIEWQFNDQPVDFDQDPRMVQAADNSLTITKTLELDSGMYTCVAHTNLDEDTAWATLTVQDVPNSPKIKDVECEGLIALVEWQPMGDRRAPILSYTIQYNTSFTPDTWEDASSNIPAPDTRFKVFMTPWANYTFRVIARNKIGQSLPSDSSQQCTTPPDVPFKNPDKVMGHGTKENNLVISWTPMPRIEQNGPGFFYKVFWKREDLPGAQWETVVISDWQQNEYVVHNQPTFTQYRLKVETHNKVGQAYVSATEVLGYSGEDRPLDAPTNFKLIFIKNANSAMFSWDPVSPASIRGHFRGYKIQTWTPEEGEERLREIAVPANVTQSLVNIFKPFSKNTVRVLTFNSIYSGPPSNEIEFTTPEGTPGPVSGLEASPLGSSALYLNWKLPLESNGILTGYRIYYEEVQGTHLGTKMERPPVTDPDEIEAKLAPLQPGTKYRITIRATTNKGQGEPYYIEATTDEEPETAPDVPELIWAQLPDEEGKAGIEVTWIPVIDGNPGSHFFVQYRRKGENQWESTGVEETQDVLVVRGLERNRLYEIRVITVDGHFQTASDTEEVTIEDLGATSSYTVATGAWFIGMMCALALMLFILFIVCLVKRNRGGKYFVHEKEAAHGRDLDYPDDGGFEYGRSNRNLEPGDPTSVNSSLRGPESETGSIADFGEGDAGQFAEDGSFIGQYSAKKKKSEETTTPSALATFV